jgi:hypothetical protein
VQVQLAAQADQTFAGHFEQLENLAYYDSGLCLHRLRNRQTHPFKNTLTDVVGGETVVFHAEFLRFVWHSRHDCFERNVMSIKEIIAAASTIRGRAISPGLMSFTLAQLKKAKRVVNPDRGQYRKA